MKSDWCCCEKFLMKIPLYLYPFCSRDVTRNPMYSYLTRFGPVSAPWFCSTQAKRVHLSWRAVCPLFFRYFGVFGPSGGRPKYTGSDERVLFVSWTMTSSSTPLLCALSYFFRFCARVESSAMFRLGQGQRYVMRDMLCGNCPTCYRSDKEQDKFVCLFGLANC